MALLSRNDDVLVQGSAIGDRDPNPDREEEMNESSKIFYFDTDIFLSYDEQ